MLKRWRPPVQVALVPHEEEEAFLRLLCMGFGFDLSTARPYFYEDPYYPHNQRWGLWVGEGRSRTLVSILTAIPLQMWVGEQLIPFMGIAGVTTHPQYRRRGYARQLLTVVLNALHAQGVPGAALQAFDFGFYRPLGWEVVGTLLRVRLTPMQLPPFPPVGVRRAVEADYPAMRQLYEQHARSAHQKSAAGRLQRDELRWSYLLWNFRHKLVYVEGDTVQGYLIYDFTEAGWVLRTREMVWRTEQARRALLGWLATNEEHVRHIEFSGTPDELAQLQLTGWRLSQSNPDEALLRWELMLGFMWRVVQPLHLLQLLLSSCSAEDGQSFCLALNDPQIEANTGVYTVLASKDGWQVERGVREGFPTIKMGMRTLAMLTMGTFSVSELVARELLTVPPALLDTLEQLFPLRSPCLRPMDYF
jgi:predicted acetyltransferase